METSTPTLTFTPTLTLLFSNNSKVFRLTLYFKNFYLAHKKNIRIEVGKKSFSNKYILIQKNIKPGAIGLAPGVKWLWIKIFLDLIHYYFHELPKVLSWILIQLQPGEKLQELSELHTIEWLYPKILEPIQLLKECLQLCVRADLNQHYVLYTTK